MAFTSGCAHVTVKKAYDKNADFSSLKTYDWIRPSEDAIINVDNRNYIESAVNSKLRSLGYEMTSVNPDFLVSIHGGIKTELIGYSIGGHPPMYWIEGKTYHTEQEQGTLVLDLVSADTKKLFWRGMAKHVFRSDPSEEIWRNL
jgi:hypothetical protein